MTQNPRMQTDLSKAPSWSDQPSSHASAYFSTEHSGNVTEVAQALAAHGGGAVSVDLALDLVLNELVQQSRDATGATGAAIALLRDGEIVCRASAGDNAPDLGVRVETTSGLAGACLSTGQIQQCRDTDTDSRVNAEACRQLGVRSMLIAPLIDGGGIFGILQVFSAWPNAFGEREVSALQSLAQAVAENKRQAEASTAIPQGVEEESHVVSSTIPESSPADDPKAPIETENISSDESEKPSESGIWTSVLSLLVICVAVVLGVVLGWHGALKGIMRPQPATTAPLLKVDSNSATSSAVEQLPVTSSDSTPPAKLDPVSNSNAAGTANSPQTQSGGLVVTENGHVIYRSPSDGLATPPTTPAPSGTRLIHRVLPEYPAQARTQNIQGPVVLDVQIGGSGEVANVDVVSGDPQLAGAAVQAVKQWRYKPHFVNGHAVESQTRITIKFTLPAG